MQMNASANSHGANASAAAPLWVTYVSSKEHVCECVCVVVEVDTVVIDCGGGEEEGEEEDDDDNNGGGGVKRTIQNNIL